MKQRKITELTDEELLVKRKQFKSNQILNAVILGVFVGIAIYSLIKNGLGFFTFFPLIFAYLLFKHQINFKELEKEIKSRNLK